MSYTNKYGVDQISTNIPCHGCLSRDRKLKPLSGEINKLFRSLLGSGVQYGSKRMICWECEATLRRVRRFQNQILQAHTVLLESFNSMKPKQKTLSNLSITTKDDYDLYYENIEQTYIETEYDLELNEPETKPDLTPTSELSHIKNCSVKIENCPLKIENCPVKIENIKQEPDISQHSDYEDNYDETNYSEISNESTTSKNQNKKTIKKIVKYDSDSSYEPNKNIKTGKGPNTKGWKDILQRNTQKYLDKYATVKDLKPEFKTPESYFKEELLDLKQMEEYNAKQEQSPCGDKCKQCRLDYRSGFLSLLRQNLEDIKPDSPTTCLLCNEKIPDSDELVKHWLYKHCAFWKCTLCNVYCKKSIRLKHLNDHHTKTYSCKKCHLELSSEYHFKLHVKKFHETFICHHCNKLLKTRSQMIKHLFSHVVICKICNKTYKSNLYLVIHTKNYHPEVYKKKVNKEAAYCVECDKQFPTKAVLQMHLNNSVRHQVYRKSYPCPECGKIFKIKYSMENHVHQVHMTEKARYVCTICNKICAHKNSLQNHIEAVHLKVPKKKDKFCEICGRGFNTNRTLNNHRRTHTGEKPFKCVHCSAAFAQKVACIGHMRKQHNDMNRYTQEYLKNY